MPGDLVLEVADGGTLFQYHVDGQGRPAAVYGRYESEAEAQAAGLVAIKVAGVWLGEAVFPYSCALCYERFGDWQTARGHVGFWPQ